MLAVIALLIGGGAGLGAIASSLTSASIRPVVETRAPMTETAMVADIDQAAAAKSWARTAFDGGLRQCPAMNAEFLAACEAEMKALAAKPGISPGRYGGPLLVTQVVEPREADAATDDRYADIEQPARYRTASYAPDGPSEPADYPDEPAEPQP